MRGQTATEFLLILAAILVVLAGVIANFLFSSSSVGSGVSGEIENTKQHAIEILKSEIHQLQILLVSARFLKY